MINSNQGTLENPMAFTIIAGGDEAGYTHVIAVDTGFEGGVSMTGNAFHHVEPVVNVLAKLGFTPEDVDTVVITHLHFDHAGNFDAFPNAQIIVQQYEYDSWLRVIADMGDTSIGKRSWKLSSIDVTTIDRFRSAVEAGKVSLIDGDREIAPGITLHVARDSHTFGSQWVEVRTPDGPFVVAGDCIYTYTNVERMWPPGYLQGNPWNLIAMYERVREIVGDCGIDRIVPGHDLQIYDRHPSCTIGENPVAEIHLAVGERTRLR